LRTTTDSQVHAFTPRVVDLCKRSLSFRTEVHISYHSHKRQILARATNHASHNITPTLRTTTSITPAVPQPLNIRNTINRRSNPTATPSTAALIATIKATCLSTAEQHAGGPRCRRADDCTAQAGHRDVWVWVAEAGGVCEDDAWTERGGS